MATETERATGEARAATKTGVFGPPAELNSLFGEILDWMLAPLLFLWPISIAVTNHVANQIANQPYDQALSESVAAIVRLVKIDGNNVGVNFPAPARAMLRADEFDTQYYQVTGLRGELVAGDRELPWVEIPERIGADEILFRDDTINGEEIRVAFSFLPVPEGRVPVLVQVAETRNKRGNLASRIISGVLLPQFAIILQRLEENLQAQQRFIADAAHQLKTPLTGLKMQSELALAESDPAQLHEFVARIAVATERAAHLTSQLLLLARAEASHEKVHSVEPLDLEVLAKRVAEEWVPRALACGIDLGFEGTGWPLTIDGIPLLLRELLNNLVDNAIKYTPRGGRVTVRTRAGTQAILEVEDTGSGIPESERQRVFERFYRVLGSEADGSGLGLAIVREIADLHRAQVKLLDADGGQGTLAQAVFPRREGEIDAAGSSA
ncbi:MAG: sensor histidine kinase [Rhodocyclales bacterium]|nr:sensor histidine kinase [Rhodocyclales bacterium]